MHIDGLLRYHFERLGTRKMLAIPLAVLLMALAVLGANTLITGSPITLGYEFVGGTVISFVSEQTPAELMAEFSEYGPVDARAFGERKLMEFPPLDRETTEKLRADISAKYSDVSISFTSPVYGRELQLQAVKGVLVAFLGMAVLVFLFFRTFVPSLAVVLSAFSDIVIAAALMDVAGIKLSLATVAALLMLIGYSVDSDILLTERVLKRKGELSEKIVKAMGTGLTMTITSLCAVLVLFIVSSYSYVFASTFSRIDILADIAVVLAFGLLADIMNTWMLNAAILKWYVQRRGRR
ncbi:protein translocase subunit SecF [Methermicoccus shengliensis]|uniref:Protein-export membrane protein SecF n=1 Tax=Methermicoccus shengliensis TaxID=660064 RepID=A0A832RYC3_9EURY|nr:protein translocase subunit SecF [Methermicoccus shengliensis]KUK04418.1 MAG: Protein-export membrane protein SecF [Euryarchaeota archaeon 55_53]KUK30575.1 MAG: Protein-export membrane protein SecF [Methanosarcinales archeaon 56_1174]MDI3488102.1 preprotein translocase subunit SecF [Methanosarcinales archaeon]MDN5295699.1 preprotein translocase subunit SecF [Methanosarcinales archaeon]HIH70167.1 protein translocase subunit SecF [Methermicoccus shengliensis]